LLAEQKLLIEHRQHLLQGQVRPSLRLAEHTKHPPAAPLSFRTPRPLTAPFSSGKALNVDGSLRSSGHSQETSRDAKHFPSWLARTLSLGAAFTSRIFITSAAAEIIITKIIIIEIIIIIIEIIETVEIIIIIIEIIIRY
jgi:hypothetical protein